MAQENNPNSTSPRATTRSSHGPAGVWVNARSVPSTPSPSPGRSSGLRTRRRRRPRRRRRRAPHRPPPRGSRPPCGPPRAVDPSPGACGRCAAPPVRRSRHRRWRSPLPRPPPTTDHRAHRAPWPSRHATARRRTGPRRCRRRRRARRTRRLRRTRPGPPRPVACRACPRRGPPHPAPPPKAATASCRPDRYRRPIRGHRRRASPRAPAARRSGPLTRRRSHRRRRAPRVHR